MSGTIPLSMTQQMDVYGDPLTGGKLYFFVAGTVSTPQNAFQDSALTLLWPNPITLDASGRVPQLFLADGLIKVRLTDQHGVTQLVADNVQVIGPSGGGGGGGTVDPTTIFSTGDVKPRYAAGAHTGWVRCNALTIGSAVSGATERANADTQALFTHLWQNDATLPVSGGRGATALADWNANKTIGVPDWRGCVIAGLDDMGGALAGRLSAAFFGNNPQALGSFGGVQYHALTLAEIPQHTHNAAVSDPTHVHAFNDYYTGGGAQGIQQVGAQAFVGGLLQTGNVTFAASTGIVVTNDYQGGNQAHTICQPTKLLTIYIKL